MFGEHTANKSPASVTDDERADPAVGFAQRNQPVTEAFEDGRGKLSPLHRQAGCGGLRWRRKARRPSQAQQWGHAGQQLQRMCWRHGKDSTLDPRLLGALFASALSCPALGRQIVTKKKGKTGKLDLLCKTAKGSTCLCTGLYKSLGVLSVVGGQCAGPSPKEALGPREQQKGVCKKKDRKRLATES